MSKELSRRYRPEHKDVEVILEDSLGNRSRIYIGFGENCHACGHPFPTGASGEVDVDAIVSGKLAALEAESSKVKSVLAKAKIEIPKGKG